VLACEGKPDIVVNAAGIIIIDDPLTITNANWEKTFSVNVTGSMIVCRAALPPMIAGGGGAIVNITSVAAFDGGAGMASYSASKAALVSYTRSIAYAHGIDRVRANTLAPGWVRTPMSEMEMDLAARENGTTREAEFSSRASRIALGRIARPEEIAACCLFLASDDSSFVTGSTLVADGGARPPVRNRAV
jgi:NAD(P)-dependent dehydrogenase (short-subunit alcohol dehydrogenase family)